MKVTSFTALLLLIVCNVFGQNAPVTTHGKASIHQNLKVSLDDYVRLVAERNEGIQAQKHEVMISRENVTRERSVFEPEFVNSYQRQGEKIKYSQDQKAQIIFSSEADKLTDSYSSLVQSRFLTGADIKFGMTQNASKDYALDEEMEYKSYLGLEITQPLLKNAGAAATTNIHVAQKEVGISFQSYRMKILEVTYGALISSWDYYSARERLKIRRESVEVAEKLLAMNKERVRLGKMAQSELLEAEAGLVKRKSWESSARQDVVTAMNSMRSFIAEADVGVGLDVDFQEALQQTVNPPDFEESMASSLELRPEYISARQKVEKEDLMIVYAKNQRWPQLDLNGSYGLNGLGDSSSDAISDAFDSDYPSWKVGITLTIPLGGGIKTRSELNAAKHRKRQALLEMKSVEVQVANAIDTAIKNVAATREQMANFKSARDVEERLLEIESERFKSGKSNSRNLLDKEDDLHYAREAELESTVNNRKAAVSLALADGSLLRKYGVDAREEGTGGISTEMPGDRETAARP